jgi:hypothetical protein
MPAGRDFNAHQNRIFAGAPLSADTLADEMAAYDSLPRALQHKLDENATNLSAVRVVNHAMWGVRQGYGVKGAIQATSQAVDKIEANELLVWAGEYRSRYGQTLPHIAAGVSIQRYGELGASRHPAHRIGKPVFRRHKGRRR